MIFVVGVILTTVLTSPAISQPQGPHPQSQPQPQPQPQPQGPQPAPVLPQNVFSDDPHSNYVPKPPAPGPKGDDYKSCKYEEPEWSDCDPFHMLRWRNRKLLDSGSPSGSSSGCQPYKNETKQCGPDHFPPGTRWLIAEHKKCVTQLEHLKNVIGDLHRWIDLIHERGQAMYHAFNELRKHLEDIQRQIRESHRQNHDNGQLNLRLKKEMEVWKERCRKVQIELEEVKTFYNRLEKEHSKMKKDFEEVKTTVAVCNKEQKSLTRRIGQMTAGNRELKGKLLDAEKVKELARAAQAKRVSLARGLTSTTGQIYQTKVDLQKCRIDLLNAKNRRPAKYNKDTHVNLDMQMWITHNQTKEEYEQQGVDYKQVIYDKYPGKNDPGGYDLKKAHYLEMQRRQMQNYVTNYGNTPQTTKPSSIMTLTPPKTTNQQRPAAPIKLTMRIPPPPKSTRPITAPSG